MRICDHNFILTITMCAAVSVIVFICNTHAQCSDGKTSGEMRPRERSGIWPGWGTLQVCRSGLLNLNSASTNHVAVARPRACRPPPPSPLTTQCLSLSHIHTAEAEATGISWRQRHKFPQCPSLVTQNKAVIVYFLNLTSDPRSAICLQ